jgi:uncharacterized protein (UPF0276 family)
MPANRFNGFTDYGIGIGLRVPHYNHILERKPVVDWFEIISENYMVDGGRPLETLDRILERYKVVQRGVSMYFGSAEPLNREHLKRLKALVRRTRTPWFRATGASLTKRTSTQQVAAQSVLLVPNVFRRSLPIKGQHVHLPLDRH